MLFDELWNVDRCLVCQEKDNAGNQELIISIIVLANGQLWVSINICSTNPESLRCFVAVTQV